MQSVSDIKNPRTPHAPLKSIFEDSMYLEISLARGYSIHACDKKWFSSQEILPLNWIFTKQTSGQNLQKRSVSLSIHDSSKIIFKILSFSKMGY